MIIIVYKQNIIIPLMLSPACKGIDYLKIYVDCTFTYNVHMHTHTYWLSLSLSRTHTPSPCREPYAEVLVHDWANFNIAATTVHPANSHCRKSSDKN